MLALLWIGSLAATGFLYSWPNGVEKTKDFYKSIEGKARPQMVYRANDFLDYVFMLLLVYLAIYLIYGRDHEFTDAAIPLCLFLFFMFPVRRGVAFRRPEFTKPLGFVQMFKEKFGNFRRPTAILMLSLCIEQLVILFFPNLPHFTIEMRTVGAYLFYTSFGVITVLRVVILVAHLLKFQHVHNFLKATGWRKLIGKRPSRIILDIIHGFCTGVLCNFLVVGNWYLMLTLFDHSLLLMPIRLYLSFKMYNQFEDEDLNSWYYRDHWLGHFSAADFIYLHGSHHDAIPVALMSASETGMLEALVRHILGHPDSYCSPLYAFYKFTLTLIRIMVGHQYVPGVFPYSSSIIQYGVHHVEHHFLQMLPLANGIDPEKCSDETNSTKFDTELDGYDPNNATWLWFCGEVKRIENYSE